MDRPGGIWLALCFQALGASPVLQKQKLKIQNSVVVIREASVDQKGLLNFELCILSPFSGC